MEEEKEKQNTQQGDKLRKMQIKDAERNERDFFLS